MKTKPVKVPNLISRSLPGLTWNFPDQKNSLYLTFDDGPTPEITPWVLNTLDKYNAKACFFCVGANVEKYPEIFEDILDRGHTIGNHSFSHLKGWKTKTKKYIADVSKAAKFIPSNLFRPPYGQIKPKQIRAIKKSGYEIVMWSVLSRDWDNSISAEDCLNNVIDHTKSGDIVVFHDSEKAAKNMMPSLEGTLAYFSDKGFEFKRIPEPDQ